MDNRMRWKDHFIVRNATLSELPFILTLATEEDWNPGLHDAGSFFAADPQGFFIGELNGVKIGCISAVNYTDAYGFIGLWVVKPEYRHCGLGKEMTKVALARLGNRVVGLNAQPRDYKNYQRSGFIVFHKTLRFEGKGMDAASCSLPLETISAVPFDKLLTYDTAIFGVSRANFLKKWIAMTNSTGYAMMENGALVGYGVIRSCVHGYRIGPLFADNPKTAGRLIQGLISKIGSSPFYIDIPDKNGQGIALAKKLQLSVVSETVRMYNSSPPAQLLDKVYGITTQELG